MFITYKYRLKLNRQQEKRIDSWMGVCRLVYNLALEIKQDALKKGLPISFNELQKQLVPLKKDYDWVKDVASESLIHTLQKLEKTYKSFFTSNTGFPKFKSKKETNSITFKHVSQLSDCRFSLPKFGTVKVFKDRQPKGEFKTAIVTKEVGKYYLCVSCKIGNHPLIPIDNQVGIDVGIANFATLSDGSFIEHPKVTSRYQDELRRQQRKLSRLRKGGKNWCKQVVVLQKLYQKIRRTRLDFLHKCTTNIVASNDLVSVENLNIEGLKQSNLAKYISDSGWNIFKQLLKYKCQLNGKTFIEVPAHYSSQECNNCGHTAKENRQSQSFFSCVKCGHEDHADLNASKNLLRRGQRLLAQSTENTLRLAKELVA